MSLIYEEMSSPGNETNVFLKVIKKRFSTCVSSALCIDPLLQHLFHIE